MRISMAPALVGAESDLFGVIDGIPVHPLVVHAAVVMVPLTALGVTAMAVWPRFSKRYGWLVALGSVVATGASFVAKESGEALEDLVGEPGFDHAELGDVMPLFVVGLLVVTVGLWLLDRSAPAEGPSPRRGLRVATAVLAVVVALANLVWVFQVGHSGAKSVWSGAVSSAETSGGAEDDD